MGRAPCCERMGLKKGAWTPEEDQILISYIQRFGHANWRALPKHAGLLRCGKSCRLRWTNYLRPDIKRGNFTPEEEESIIKLHEVLGNRWSAIAARLPGRTDNEIKNVWHTHLKKRLLQHHHHHQQQHDHSTATNNRRRRITTHRDLLPGQPIKSESTTDDDHDHDHLETKVSSEPAAAADDDDQHLLVIVPSNNDQLNNNSGADSPVLSSYSSFDDNSTMTTATNDAAANNHLISTTTISNSKVEHQYNCDSNDNSSFSALHLNDGFWAEVLSGADPDEAGLQSTSSSSPNYYDDVNVIMNNDNIPYRNTGGNVDDNMQFLYDDYHLSAAAFEETHEFIMEILRAGTT